MSTEAPVVVAVDGSGYAGDAVRWAARTAVRLGRPLIVVCVVPPMTPQFSLVGLAHEDAYVRASRRFGKTTVQTAGDLAKETEPEVSVQLRLVEGKPMLALRQESSNAHLLVVGRRGLGGVRGLLMGSVSTDLAAHSDCPVAVVPEYPQNPAGSVVVGVDGSSLSTRAIDEAFDQASSLGTSVTAVHTYEGSSGIYDFTPAVLDQMRDAAAEALRDQLAKPREKHPGVAVESVVTTSSAADEVSRHSADAQMVVLGSRGRGGFRGLILGSTSQAVMRVAKCPVMIVHSQ